LAAGEPPTAGRCAGTADLQHWIEHWEHKASEGAGKLVRAACDLPSFWRDFGARAEPLACARPGPVPAAVAELRTGATVSANIGAAFLGCDVGSPTAKAVQLDGEARLLASFYDRSTVNPIEAAQALMRQAPGVTRCGEDLLCEIVGADVSVVETVVHATAASNFFPDADVIFEAGGGDVKILILRQGTVSDFRLNSRYSSGDGTFLQGVAERRSVPLAEYAGRAFTARTAIWLW
jgi:activator of 2-hydroxyglutaryl-CoA dehydratase